MILLQLLLVGRKIVQIRQTEPVGVCPEAVHKYSERFSLSKTQGNKNRRNSKKQISSLLFSSFQFIGLRESLYQAFSLPCVVCAFCYSLFL